MDNLALYHEEERAKLIEINKGIAELLPVLKQIQKDYVAPSQDVNVSGKVEVNTEKEVEVSNIQDVVASVESLSDKLTKAIETNSHKPLESVTVKNIDQAKADKVTINNLTDLKRYFDGISKAIEDNQPIVNVAKQDIVFPRLARDAIPVRLSDGKQFYNAITQAVSNTMSAYKDSSGRGVQAEVDATNAVKVTAGGLVPYNYDQITINTYNANDDPTSVTYKLDGATLATLTITYDASNRITNVTRT